MENGIGYDCEKAKELAKKIAVISDCSPSKGETEVWFTRRMVRLLNLMADQDEAAAKSFEAAGSLFRFRAANSWSSARAYRQQAESRDFGSEIHF